MASALFEKKPKGKPLHGSKIEDYALIGDCETGALVSREGSIDWLCWPNFASPACFTALLGTREHGFWQLRPKKEIMAIRRQYRHRTMIVETTYETAEGEVLLIDFMPFRSGMVEGHSRVVRIVRGVRGKVAIRMDLAIRFDYGRTIPWVTDKDGELRAVAGADMVVLRSADAGGKPLKLTPEGLCTSTEFTVKAGESVVLSLIYGSSLEPVPERLNAEEMLEETDRCWQEWIAKNGYKGEHREAVERSLMTLKAMTYAPSGGIVAAVTAGLPEGIGGVRNWDYRYCWLRDTSLTLLVLLLAGYQDEAVAWRRWLLRSIAGAPDQLQTMYGIWGDRQLNEWTADWLPGYEDSKPVRIGNAASTQFQLDVYGEVSQALAHTPVAEEQDIQVSATAVQSSLINHLCHVWPQKDDGIWETRGPQRHFVHSKVMAWVALDRALKHNNGLTADGDRKRWAKNRDMLHAEICRKGFNKKLNSFVQSYGSDQLDAACLTIAMTGFLPADDPRVIGTVEAIEKYLMRDGLILRYDPKKAGDGLPGTEGSFLACSFWMVTNLYLIGREEDARAMFDRLLRLRNDVGLLSEEWDPKLKRMTGNFPQAFSHLAMTHAAFTLAGEWTPDGTDSTAA